MGPVRRDDRAGRQGPVDEGRLTGPIRRDRARGVRQRAAAQRPVRVPEHRRQEDVDLQGARARPRPRSSTSFRPSSCGSSSCARGRTPPSSSTPTGPMPSRACSTSRTAWRRPPPVARSGRAAAGRRARLRLQPGRARRRCRGRGCGLPPAVQPPRIARAGARRRRRGARRRREGRAAHRARGRDPRGAPPCGPCLAGDLRARTRRASRCSATRCRPRPPSWTTTSASTSPRLAAARAAGVGRRVVPGVDLRHRQGPRPRRRATPSARCTSRSWAGRTDRAPAGWWRRWIRRSWPSGCARRPPREHRRERRAAATA